LKDVELARTRLDEMKIKAVSPVSSEENFRFLNRAAERGKGL
jgi:hypothetical protein